MRRGLRRPSPIGDLANVTPSEYLDMVFMAGDKTCVSISKTDQGFIYPIGDSKRAARLARYVTHNDTGVWFQANPVNGELVNGYSLRCGLNLVAYRHILLESDDAPPDLWLKFLVQLEEPIVSIQRSGNESIHALIQVQAETSAEFDKIKDRFIREYVPFGADPKPIRAVQQVRLPNVVRNDYKRNQTLLFLNPNADGTPIYKKNSVAVLSDYGANQRTL
jgi:hypothetical protein